LFIYLLIRGTEVWTQGLDLIGKSLPTESLTVSAFFTVVYFSHRVSLFTQGASNHDLPTSAFHVVGIIDVNHTAEFYRNILNIFVSFFKISVCVFMTHKGKSLKNRLKIIKNNSWHTNYMNVTSMFKSKFPSKSLSTDDSV
jgi:hypothetical protein